MRSDDNIVQLKDFFATASDEEESDAVATHFDRTVEAEVDRILRERILPENRRSLVEKTFG